MKTTTVYDWSKIINPILKYFYIQLDALYYNIFKCSF